MNIIEIKKELHRYLQNQFYLKNRSDDVKVQMQHAAAKYIHEKYPDIKKVIVTVNYFNEISIEMA